MTSAARVFGAVVADIHVVEFQKRGLPHAHILLTLAIEDRIVTAEEIDNFISGELPNKESDPQLFEIVAKTMIYVGNGTTPTISIDGHPEDDWIKIPDHMLIDGNDTGIRHLIAYVYNNFSANLYNDSYLQERAILAPGNEDVDHINSLMLEALPGELKTYLSADSAISDKKDTYASQFLPTPEYLHSLDLPGIAKHCLQLKIGVPIILLRNLNPSVGLCNRT
ncbi:uncharacterized protein LOC143888510 [Tasmannia lanceolata]|uniref:uncharacterized protein LOC143888510 n=1 Tax=Tasmannia lanceolata TaxID=3420 RepID=UPI0040642E57